MQQEAVRSLPDKCCSNCNQDGVGEGGGGNDVSWQWREDSVDGPSQCMYLAKSNSEISPEHS